MLKKYNPAVSALVMLFYNGKIDRIDVYAEGFGGFYVSRVKDGMVIGYKDRAKRFSADDHVTVFFNKEDGFSGLHRRITDSQSIVYISYAVDYFLTDNGIRKLLQDMQKVPNTSLFKKTLFLMVYQQAKVFYNLGFSLVLISKTKAKQLGVKSPCIYIKPKLTGKILLIVFSKIIQTLALVNTRKFGNYPSRGFKSQNFPGSIVSKKKLKD
jgi:hypothetical protein